VSAPFDVVINHGRFFDGRGSPAHVRHVGMRDGTIAAISESPLSGGGRTEVVDAHGALVMPGFIDMHTHYDAELELAPALSESVRHGVTSVILGSCSLSLATGTPEDLADMFCRVEAVPYDAVRSMLEKKKDWDSHADYLDHLDSLPLGPNVAAYCGHSAVRAKVMGLDRALARGLKPTPDEMQRMKTMLTGALDAGYVGLSLLTLPWDKMGGSRKYRSSPLPSAFARWSEYRELAKILRQRGRVLQGVPNYITQINIFGFLLESLGVFRRPLKTSVLTLMDVRSDRKIWRLARWLSSIGNALGARFRWQALPDVFDLWIDGMEVVVFEEFRAGRAWMHLEDPVLRKRLLLDQDYRGQFKRDWANRSARRMFHRDLSQAHVVGCPDSSLQGKSFAEIAQGRGQDPVDAFLDLVSEHGRALRWHTVMGNDRRGPLEVMMAHRHILVGFSDAGAHLRNMAHYNFPLRLLRLAVEAQKTERPFMSLERAVHRVTGELAEWFGIDAGVLQVGKRADVTVVRPEALDESLDRAVEAPMPGIPDLQRMVCRNDRAIQAVFVNGRRAVSNGAPVPELGVRRGFGRVLRAQS
jgi:N-acyl-D-aspartate/D-glutamate deacylase